MFSECCSPEELRREAACQRRLAAFLKDRVVAATMRAAAEELEQQAAELEHSGARPLQRRLE